MIFLLIIIIIIIITVFSYHVFLFAYACYVRYKGVLAFRKPLAPNEHPEYYCCGKVVSLNAAKLGDNSVLLKGNPPEKDSFSRPDSMSIFLASMDSAKEGIMR